MLLPISTHTLTWSVTRSSTDIGKVRNNFNSHAHVERDIFPLLLILLDVDFNSHAHVERDDYISMLNDALENFNSHAHVERDLFTSAAYI